MSLLSERIKELESKHKVLLFEDEPLVLELRALAKQIDAVLDEHLQRLIKKTYIEAPTHNNFYVDCRDIDIDRLKKELTEGA